MAEITENIKPISILISIIFVLTSLSFGAGISVYKLTTSQQDYKIEQQRIRIDSQDNEITGLKLELQKIKESAWSQNDLLVMIQNALKDTLIEYGILPPYKPIRETKK